MPSFLRITRKLASNNAKRLRKILNEEKLLCNLSDFNIFFEDFSARNFLPENSHIALTKLFSASLGTSVLPAYQLIKYYNESTYTSTIGNRKFKNLTFAAYLSMEATSSLGNIFSIGTHEIGSKIFDDFRCNLFDPIASGKIFSFALYFYNKRELYLKAREILKTNQGNLEKNLGLPLVKDLFALFSAPKNNKIPKNFYSKEVTKKEIILETEAMPKEITSIYIGFSSLRYSLENSKIDVGISLFLTPKNNLIAYLSLMPSTPSEIFEKGISSFKNDVSFNNFFFSKINAWLRNLDLFTSFGMCLYRKLKLKILIGEF